MSELKPCPNEFCRSTSIGVSGLWHSIKKHYSKVDRISCNKCGASLEFRYVTMEEAIEAWNTRPGEDSLKAHAIEVLADQLWDNKNTLDEARAEARALLGWEE